MQYSALESAGWHVPAVALKRRRSMDVPGGESADDELFLPDFCAIGTLFSVVLVGELLAFVLVLATSPADWLGELAFTSLFVQWVALGSAGLLCAGRRWLTSLSSAAAGIGAWALVLVVTAAVGEAAWWLVELPAPGANGHALFQLRNLGIGAIVSAVVLRYFYVQHQWKRRVESEARARFQALQARIRPHFLFNSMNTIAALARTRPAVAEQVTEDLADLFRASLGDATAPATLARELELCREYVRIEMERLGERLRTEWQLDGLPGDALLPPLTLQPLLENAVYHGIEPRAEGGVVRMTGSEEDGVLHITLENPMEDGGVAAGRPHGNHMAQANVRERLAALFGPAARLDVYADAQRYRVSLRFPYRSER